MKFHYAVAFFLLALFENVHADARGNIFYTNADTAVTDEPSVTFLLFDLPDGLKPYKAELRRSDLNLNIPGGSFAQTLRWVVHMQTNSAGTRVAAEKHFLAHDCKLYSATGDLIDTFDALENDMHVYVVKSRFIYPTYEVGHTINVTVEGDRQIELTTLSTEPRIFKLGNLMSPEEVDQLIASSERLKIGRSKIGSSSREAKMGTSAIEKESIKVRTSGSAFDPGSAISIKIKTRAHELLRMGSKITIDDMEGFQIVKYEEKQFYDFHHDHMDTSMNKNIEWSWDPTTGGVNRFATVFVYLSDTELGGATAFPLSTSPVPEISDEEQAAITEAKERLFEKGSLEYQAVEQCQESFYVRPKKGDAIVFYLQDRLGNLDDKSLHGACPVLKGSKIGANLWLYNGEMRKPGVKLTFEVIFFNSLSSRIEIFWKEGDDENGEMILRSTGIYRPGETKLSRTESGRIAVVKLVRNGEIVQIYRMKPGIKKIDVIWPYHAPQSMIHPQAPQAATGASSGESGASGGDQASGGDSHAEL